MTNRKLISMLNYVTDIRERVSQIPVSSTSLCPQLEYIVQHETNYMKFLKLKPGLWMFIPCDQDGNVLEEPVGFDLWEMGLSRHGDDDKLFYSYQEAKKRVLFEGFEYISSVGAVVLSNGKKHIGYISNGKWKPFAQSVEELIIHEPTLTPNAIDTYQI